MSERLWLRTLLSPWARRLALAGFVATFFLPLERFGFDFCPVHQTTGLPCPGCGMTRAMAMVSQGKWAMAIGMHPFVVMVWPFVGLLAFSAFAPARIVTDLESRLDFFEPWLSRAFRVVLIAFVAFGLGRFLLLLIRGESFP